MLPTVLKFLIINNGGQINKELFLLQPTDCERYHLTQFAAIFPVFYGQDTYLGLQWNLKIQPPRYSDHLKSLIQK